MKRKNFLKYMATAGVLGGMGIYTWQIEPFWLEFVKVRMPIKHLPSHLEGNTLMQLSDIHIGPSVSHSFIINALKKAQSYRPDYVVYTGDYISYDTNKELYKIDEVFRHAVKGSKGTFGILGNHDYGHRWKRMKIGSEVSHILDSNGIEMLRNRKKEIDGLHIIGLDDYWGNNFHPHRALQDIKTYQANVVLCHNPDVADQDIWNGYQGWILSGHTHGGQCKPPFLPPPILPVKNKRYTAGKIDLYDGRTLYINRALGHLLQVRFNVRPEITLFRLEKA